MEQTKAILQYLLGEPFAWLFYCIFQPTKFGREISYQISSLNSSCRLVLPIFLLSYPLAFLVQETIHAVFLQTASSIMVLLLTTAVGTILGATFVIVGNINLGIIGGIAGGIVLSITGDTSLSIIMGSALLLVEGMFFLATSGTFISQAIIIFIAEPLLCIVVGIIDVSNGRQVDITNGIIVGIVGAIVVAATWSIVQLVMGGIRWILSQGDKARVEAARGTIISGCISLIITGSIILIGSYIFGLTKNLFKVSIITEDITASIIRLIILTSGSFSAVMIVLAIALIPLGGFRYITSGGESGKVGSAKTTIIYGCGSLIIFGSIEALLISVYISHPFDLSLTGIISGSVVRGLIGGGIGGILGSILVAGIGNITSRAIRGSATSNVVATNVGQGFLWGILWGILWSISGKVLWGIVGGILLLIGSIFVSYRLPLYPLSAFSMLKTSTASRSKPSEVFIYLHRSSLYWDECVVLPLVGLRQTLLVAIQQNVQQTLEEIDFIAAERPQQIYAARIALLEIVIQDLERRDNLRDIAQASERLSELLPLGTNLINPQRVPFLAQLSDASREAARACSPLGWQAKHEALEEMLTVLKHIHTNITRDINLDNRLAQIVKNWLNQALQELEELDQALEKTSRISNPYSPGPVLESRNRLFVGRDDLVRQLEESLNKGENRPTFLLNGERRMGKSSVLKQLSARLGNHYLSIYYDLLTPGISSSTTALLRYIAEGIHHEMTLRGITIKQLDYKRLQDASRVNEAAIYLPFEEWLRQVEHVLEEKHRTLLLTFDEFEKLEAAGQKGYFNLELLLDWFRSAIQGHHQTALLFSGIQTFGEMGALWARAFVNVQILKVSFLHFKEARQLVVHPTRNFPSEQIFGSGVVDELLRVTGCHPFFVQGVCSELIEHLNAEEHFRAEIDDVAIAMNRFLDAWWPTYFRDLWERTDEKQRTCLLILHQLGKADLLKIEQQSGLDRRTTRDTLEMLRERDIILLEQNSHQIAAPIFNRWVERHT
jgi:uncharacterized protein